MYIEMPTSFWVALTTIEGVVALLLGAAIATLLGKVLRLFLISCAVVGLIVSIFRPSLSDIDPILLGVNYFCFFLGYTGGRFLPNFARRHPETRKEGG